MNCPHCHTANCFKNGTSRHGHQRWRCPACKKTFGDKDRRCVAPETKAAALAQYLEGVGQRATERLLGGQPQLHYQLGETGGVWPSLETDARRKGGVGRGG